MKDSSTGKFTNPDAQPRLVAAETAVGLPSPRGRELVMSRRQWLAAMTAAMGATSLPGLRRQIRRRRPGEPAPTGWFGHC